MFLISSVRLLDSGFFACYCVFVRASCKGKKERRRGQGVTVQEEAKDTGAPFVLVLHCSRAAQFCHYDFVKMEEQKMKELDRTSVECAVIDMGDVDVCIKMVDDAIEEKDMTKQVRAVKVLIDIFNSRYGALYAAVCGE